jgi:hypothetical protein
MLLKKETTGTVTAIAIENVRTSTGVVIEATYYTISTDARELKLAQSQIPRGVALGDSVRLEWRRTTEWGGWCASRIESASK